ncbi:hypothetical protein SAMN05877809_105277 [Rhodobacter sp. JA431]|uniref:hypothetical protein n=1 Tax=Rhodobacter sp. JA431 TaxID=570013 RepID=UPI000BCE761B|nr:hypothetical protein [Rhodobacter sp. JA431]SOC11402.1 hypothetical protein SAMN05877809_105277 [Rhodobacter sp. JA431]
MSMVVRRGARMLPAKVVLYVAVMKLAGAADRDMVAALSEKDCALVQSWVMVLDWALAQRLVARRDLFQRDEAGAVDVVLGLGRMQSLSQAYVMARAAAPASCGPEIVAAPARGASMRFQPEAMVPKGEADWQAEAVGFRGRDAVRRADLFDKMERAALRAGREVPFSPGQVSAGRAYAALVEFVSAGGVKLSSLEGRVGGGAGGGEAVWIERYSQASAKLRRLRAAIGDEAALSVRRVRPSKRVEAGSDGLARGISDRVLVDGVCVMGMSLGEVLVANGWAKSGQNIEAVRVALAAALERMRIWA